MSAIKDYLDKCSALKRFAQEGGYPCLPYADYPVIQEISDRLDRLEAKAQPLPEGQEEFDRYMNECAKAHDDSLCQPDEAERSCENCGSKAACSHRGVVCDRWWNERGHSPKPPQAEQGGDDKIAKYREEGHPGKWWLTDFTMKQVEGRIADLRAEQDVKDAMIKGLREAANDLRARLDEVKKERDDAYEQITCILEEKPFRDKGYTHLGYCNSTRQCMPGTLGVTCNCMPHKKRITAERNVFEKENAELKNRCERYEKQMEAAGIKHDPFDGTIF